MHITKALGRAKERLCLPHTVAADLRCGAAGLMCKWAKFEPTVTGASCVHQASSPGMVVSPSPPASAATATRMLSSAVHHGELRRGKRCGEDRGEGVLEM